MAITIDTLTQTRQKMQNALVQSVNIGQTDITQKIDPTRKNSLIGGFVDALSAGINDNNRNLQKVQETLVDLFLEQITVGLSKNDAQIASGNITFTGTIGGTIPSGTSVINIDGLEYQTQSTGIIANQVIDIISINRVGSLVTVETDINHNLTANVLVSIVGADQTEYNIVNQFVNITSETTFTFEVIGSPVTPATGTITLSYNGVTIEVQSVDVGANKNLSSNSVLTLSSPIINVDNDVYTTYSGVFGGLDEETDSSFLDRKLEYINNPPSGFNSGGIISFLKENVDGITRVFVKEITPSIGFVTIYFVRDNDTNIIPTPQQVTNAKNALIDPDTGIKPAELSSNNVIVSAPTPKVVNFQFTELVPNTLIMQQAVSENLDTFFRNQTNFETNVKKSDYNNIIYSTTDSQSNILQSFTLLTPYVDIIVGIGEMPTLGDIIFPAI